MMGRFRTPRDAPFPARVEYVIKVTPLSMLSMSSRAVP